MNCFKSQSQSLSLWMLAPPELEPWPATDSAPHLLWAVSKDAHANVTLPTAFFSNPTHEEPFPDVWERENEVRRDTFAPKWNPPFGTCMKSSIVHDPYFIYERFIYEP